MHTYINLPQHAHVGGIQNFEINNKATVAQSIVLLSNYIHCLHNSSISPHSCGIVFYLEVFQSLQRMWHEVKTCHYCFCCSAMTCALCTQRRQNESKPASGAHGPASKTRVTSWGLGPHKVSWKLLHTRVSVLAFVSYFSL